MGAGLVMFLDVYLLFSVKSSFTDDGLPSDSAQSHDVRAEHHAEPLEEERESGEGQHNLLSENSGHANEVQNCLGCVSDAFLLLLQPGLQVIHGSSQTLEEEPGAPIGQSCEEEANAQGDEDDGEDESCDDVHALVLFFACRKELIFQAV